MSVSKKPMVLVILDGYGYREEQQDNAIFSAKTPVMDALWANRPHTLIDASGLEVGLPDRQIKPMPDLRFFFVVPRKIAFQLTRWLYLPHRAGILLSWFF